MISSMLQFFLGIILIWFGADSFIKSSKRLATDIGISPLLIGLTIGALGTSLPEIIVSWMAAGIGNTDISIGNAVGSNMANIGLALAIGAIILPIPVEKDVVIYDYWVLLFSAFCLYFFSKNLYISRLEGILFVLVFIIYVVLIAARHYIGRSEKTDKEKSASLGKFTDWLVFIAGTGGLIFGAKVLVNSAVSISQGLNISETVIGITAVAIGTSLPEIAVLIAGSLRKEQEISLGTIVGSNIINILVVVGGASVIKEIALDESELLIQAPAVFVFSLFLLPILLFKRNIKRTTGIILMLVYALYIYLVI